MEHNEFRKYIDELFRLFKKLMDQHPVDEIPGIDKAQFEQMRIFIQNYEIMKDQISIEMMGSVNEPMKQMLISFVKHLRRELGEDAEQEMFEPSVKQPDSVISVEKIDELLRNPNLTEEEINQLLDQRARVSNL